MLRQGSPISNIQKRSLMDYSRFISPKSARRQPSAIRSLAPLLSLPGMISLGGGNPHPDSFPYVGLSFRLRSGEVIDVPEKEVQQALQYSPTNGIPQLVSWLKNLQLTEHKPPTGDNFEICLGNGSQDVLTKAFDMLLSEGDTLLCESPAYVGSLAYLRPLGCKFAEVPSDGEGLQPEALESVLANWKDIATRPRVLYTVPIGGNPTGCSTTLDRKKKIYEIARKYDIIILEDDPYYYLQFGNTRTASYFSMDVDQRVLRFDSFSKILSAGVRVGWVTGPKPLVDRIVLHSQASILHASGMSQMMVYKVLEHWGIEGFLAHTSQVSAFYENKGKAFMQSAEKHLKGLAEWVQPNAGMFVWIKLLNGVMDSSSLIKTKAVEKKVLMVPGFEFFPNPRTTPYVRASFSTATEEEIDIALARLAEIIKEEQ
ncbi:PLP-dependent transferase [Rhizoclosmatium globosum]|uniref:PLP-dependent transferase n=1 Tax=Rhizoclosmatium globosum TaxID=329046 RepID=A0A1Y2CL06_9FUNG|nr:PLP-dependent transferase [Rhizoclosmatium globosum]|eukprot:ORY46995.1 PLP-dependent transferase [Rhizoclosmatium globosum]